MKKIISFVYEHNVLGSIVDFACECEIEYSVDQRFGEDADGNRFTTKVEIEEVKILSVDGKPGTGDLREDIIEGIHDYAGIKFYES